MRVLLFAMVMVVCAGEASAQQTAAVPATAPAASQTAPGEPARVSHSGPKHDSKLPIEISSDSLEVLQHDNKAIFRGNVIAVQGDMRLKSDVMTVHYKQKSTSSEPQPPSPPPASSAGTPGMMGAITRIDVQGNVFMATPEESAKGDVGDYDVETKTIHLFGNDVTLTRGKNILKGTALEYNTATGRSVLTNNGSNTNITPGTPMNGRVRGVFVPESQPSTGAGTGTTEKK